MVKPTFKYPRRSVEDVQRRAKQSSGRYDSYLTTEVTWFKPRPGENCIRLVPWLFESDPDFKKYDEKWGNHWGIDIIVHRNVGQDNGTYLCLDKMKGEPCPVCDAWRGEDLDELKPSDRVLCWLIDRNDEKAGPQLWAMPLGVSKDISAVSQVKGSGEVLLIDHWDEGYDVFFDREGEKKRTQYKRVSVARDPSPLADTSKMQENWLSYVLENRLPDLLKFYETDYLEKILSGQRGSNEEPEKEDNVRPIRGRRDDTASDDREDNSRRGDDRAEAPRSRRSAEDDYAKARRAAADDAVEQSADHDHEAEEARDWGHGRRVAAAEADVAPSPRERRRPREADDREPADGTVDRARGRLERVGRRNR